MSYSDWPPYFPFYASDYLSSSKVQRMTLEEEGAYLRLLCYNWQDGFIPNDIGELARLCKVTPKKMAKIWERISEHFGEIPENFAKLFNPRIEHERQKYFANRSLRQVAGSIGGHAKHQNRLDKSPENAPESKTENSSNARILLENDASKTLANSSLTVTVTDSKENTTYSPSDSAFETFREAHDKARAPAKYQAKPNDWVKLAEMRKGQGVPARGSPPNWEIACANYFATPQSKYTMGDLSSRYAVFVVSALDRYGKPVTGEHDGQQQNSRSTEDEKFERTRAAGLRLLARLTAQASSGVPSGDERSDTSGLSGDFIDAPGKPS
jgi:uncharacterized protein YdaU (DUF1376 family)